MPELPDVTVYVERLQVLLGHQPLEHIRLASPFLLRSVDPPVSEAEGKRVRSVARLGKRIVIGLEAELFLVLHLMIAGRLQWKTAGAPVPRRLGLAAFDFPSGMLLLTEAGTKKRASLHLVRGGAGLAAFDRGGVEPLEAGLEEFREALLRENHTLKRALTDPRLLSGIGNAYSDEILHHARLSPVRLTHHLAKGEIARLYQSTGTVLRTWTERIRETAGEGLPEKVTAFQPGMAVHGRYGEPCPVCGSLVQRIRYADRETNYCATCQTGGRLLADRALSRLLKGDWPRSLEEMEGRRGPRVDD